MKVVNVWTLANLILKLFILDLTRTNGLSSDGLVLLAFKMSLVNADDVLHNWNENDENPCNWSGVGCYQNSTRVTYLNLPNRRLTGTISPVLGKLIQLRRLGLHENSFVGPIPDELLNLTSLRALYLRGNSLTGPIPPKVGELYDLHILDVSRNELRGTIPASLGNLHKLQYLNLSHNLLFGEIPTTGSLPTFKSSSFEGNIGLCGPQVNEECNQVPLKSPATAPGAVHSPHYLGIFQPENTLVAEKKLPSSAKYLNGLIIAITAITAAPLLLIAVTSFLLYCKKRRRSRLIAQDSDETNSSKFGAPKLVMFRSDSPYSSNDIIKKIQKLDDGDVIGSGGFGTVYRLVLEDGSWFAVKKIRKRIGSESSFLRELERLGSLQHRNLVNLRGYCCTSPSSKLLIYDYFPHGNLDEHLHEREPHEISLTWTARLKIATGTARALAFLHHACRPSIIHREIKSSNILLDDRLEPRVSDFGLATLLDEDEGKDESRVTTIVAGTFGYLAPEYMQSGRATQKSDVYSYGVLLLELISGKRPTDPCFVEAGLNIVGWVVSCTREGRQEVIFDPICPSGPPREDIENVLHVAIMCIAANPAARPTMGQVTQMLENKNISTKQNKFNVFTRKFPSQNQKHANVAQSWRADTRSNLSNYCSNIVS